MGNDAVFAGAESLDLFVRARFLRAKVIGREAENDESLVFVLFVDRLQSGILRRVAALAGHVDDHHDFTFVVGQGCRFPVDGVEGETVNAGSGEQRRGHDQKRSEKEIRFQCIDSGGKSFHETRTPLDRVGSTIPESALETQPLGCKFYVTPILE
jgi:hypothetical protein